MSRQNALAVHRQDEHGELISLGRRSGQHRQPVIRAHRKFINNGHDLLAGVLLLGLERTGAIGKKDVGFAFGHQHTVDRASRRGCRRVGTSGQLQRLPLQRSERAGLELVGLTKHLPGVVAGRVRARGRGAELDVGIEHAIEECRRLDGKPRPYQGAEPVAGEQRDGAALTRRRQCLWMPHIGGGKHLGAHSARDLVLQRTGRPIFGVDLLSRCSLECTRHLGQGAAQAAGGMQEDRL